MSAAVVKSVGRKIEPTRANARRALSRLVIAMLLAGAGCLHRDAAISVDALPEGVPHTDRPFGPAEGEFRFAIVSDRTGGHRPGVFASALEQVNRLQPEFVLCVGDLIEGYSQDPATIASEWEEIEAMVERLDMPFFYTVGNHDVSNPAMLEAWHARHGHDYWAFVYRDVLFLSLSTEDPPIELSADVIERKNRFERMLNEDPERVERMLAERARAGVPKALPSPVAISDEQVDFVRRTLDENTDVRWTIVLMHKPAWKQEEPSFARIESMLRDRPYTVVAGHEHSYEYAVRHGREYFVLGTTGGVWISRGPGAMDHVMWATMTDDGPVLAPIRLDGMFGPQGP